MSDVKWIKLATDLFEDEKILLLDTEPDADALIVLWVKLLCLAGKQNRRGVFEISNGVACTTEMLAMFFRRPVELVERALEKAATDKTMRRAIEGGMLVTEAFEKFGVL